MDMEKDYANCQHEWVVGYLIPTVPWVRCEKCQLSIEVYKDHVSVWDYSDNCVDNPLVGKIVLR